MTLADLRNSRTFWRGVKIQAKRNHGKYVKLTRNTATRPGDDRYEFLWARRTYWSRRLEKATRMVEERDREIRAREPQQVSDAGMTRLVREEGVRRYAYNDPAGHATFGVGHLLHHGNVTSADRAKWGTPEAPKSMEFVFDVLRKDLDAFETAVRDSVKGGRIPQNRFDAMVSLAFNIGIGGFKSSSVVKRYNAGDIRGAADAFLLWDNPAMLRARRERERALFLKR